MTDFESFLRPDLASMAPYTPIVPFEVLSQRLGRRPEEIIKLDANENPYGPSPRALAVLTDGLRYHTYPDPEAGALTAALSDQTGVPQDNLICGMGADELIDLVLRAVLRPRDGVIDCPPSFGMYPFSTAVNFGRYVPVPRRPDFSLDLQAIEAAVAADSSVKVIFACSPNNPSGNLLSETEFERLLALPVLVVLDEAYIEFADPQGDASRIRRVPTLSNLCVLRTFSKMAGLAGLRVGYGAFPGWLRPHLMKIKQPYNVNVAAAAAAKASLADIHWLREKVALLVQERDRLIRELGRFTFLRPFPSAANFVLCEVLGQPAGELKQRLQDEHGILIRYYANPRLENYVRITAARPGDTNRLLAALDVLDGEL